MLTLERLTDGGTELRIIDIGSGVEVLRVTEPRAVSEAILVGDVVFFVSGVRSTPGDQGIAMVRAPAAVVTSFTSARDNWFSWSRGLLVRSATGRTIASQVQRVDGDFMLKGSPTVEVTTIESRSSSSVELRDTNLMAISDEVVVSRNGPTIRTNAIADGALLWERTARGSVAGYLTSDGRLLIQPMIVAGEDWKLLVLDAWTGSTPCQPCIPERQ